MGYPMTLDRVIHRNGLATGDYDHPAEWALNVNLDSLGLVKSQEEFDQIMVDDYRRRIREYEQKARMLLGDLRRLEHDAVDEDGTCRIVASRSGVDPETVAVVIREFMRA